jgi:hypothetical protein
MRYYGLYAWLATVRPIYGETVPDEREVREVRDQPLFPLALMLPFVAKHACARGSDGGWNGKPRTSRLSRPSQVIDVLQPVPR